MEEATDTQHNPGEMRQLLDDLNMSQTALARHMKDLGDTRDEKNILRSIQRMVAGDARVSGEMKALLGTIRRAPKPFVFTLDPDEVELIQGASGTGGHQSLHRRLVAELRNSPDGNEVTFTDEQLGELLRYMSRYGSGGFQSRLRDAFMRSILGLLRNN